ncbi:hypothetical protein GGI35DRAFT_207296 [Trichoderma velutinum]
MCAPNTSSMTGTPSDHGGLYYIELIKSNLQFIYGKECSFEVLSQVKAPDQWKVSILKTEDGLRSVHFFDSGAGFLNVLEKLHRTSAEKLSKFMSDNAADAYAYVRRKEGEAARAAKSSSSKDQKEMKEKMPSRTPVFEATVVPPRDSRISSMVEGSDSDSSDGISEFTNRRRAQSLWRARNASDEVVSIKSDSSLRSRSLICPNYGPASAFYRVSPHDLEVLDEIALRSIHQTDRDLRATEKGKSKAASTVSAPAVAPVPAPDSIKAQAQPLVTFQAESEVPNNFARLQRGNHGHRHRAGPPPALRNVLVFIRWPDFGDAVVADECQLSVQAVQNRVRHMLRSYGSELFNLTKPFNPLMFRPAELANSLIVVKAVSIDDQRFVLGPNVGDDLTKVFKDLDNCKSVKIEVELQSNLGCLL